MLEQTGIDLKSLNLNKIKLEYQELESKKKELSVTYKTCEKESSQIRKQLEDLQRYIGQEQPSKSQQTKNNTHFL